MESPKRVLIPISKRFVSLFFAFAVGFSLVESGVISVAARPSHSATVGLKIQRHQERIDVVLANLGVEVRVIQKSTNGSDWTAILTGISAGKAILKPQQVVLDSSKFLSARLEPQGSDLKLVVQSRSGETVPSPQIKSNGNDLIFSFMGLEHSQIQTYGKVDLRAPGRVAQSVAVPPMQPRAVAPPLGDMAIGTMVINSRGYVQAKGPLITLTLNNASAKDALMALARLGEYGFVFVRSSENQSTSVNSTHSGNLDSPVTMAFRNEPYDRVLNSILLSSGLQGRLDGKTLLVGRNILSKSFGPQQSKILRMNQASAVSVANYLGSLGATVNAVVTAGNASSDANQVNSTSADLSSRDGGDGSSLAVRSYSASSGPLKGLIVTTDSRLQAVTLVGDAALLSVAEGYVRQLDIRQRQVALSVRILDINLTNDAAIENSFAFRKGNNFIVSDRGELVAAFGALLPPNNGSFDVISGGASSGKSEYKTLQGGQDEIIKEPLDPAQINPGRIYDNKEFVDLFRSLITSSNAKTLASPTLILSESSDKLLGEEVAISSDSETLEGSAFASASIGRPYANEAFVTVGTRVTTNYEVSPGQNGAPNSCQPVEGTAGLTFGARVSKIDDNGFVTFSLSPAISAVTDTEFVENCGSRNVLSIRRIDTGSLRVRDGQTLVLTGVISDIDAQIVRKWPIVGDMPFIGQFFRQSARNREKRELVILVTPRIIDDVQGGKFGYGYSPELPAARQVLSSY